MTLQHAHTALDDLIVRAEWLDDSLAPGTPRPYQPPRLSAEACEAADALAREERRERVAIAPGDSPDPIWTDGVELRGDLLALADAMAEQVAQTAGVDRMPDASWDSDPAPYLQHTRRWLQQAAEVDANLTGHVTRKARQYIARCDQALGLLTDGQTIPALCFVCGGRDDQHPIGGAHTLRFRIKHAEHPASEHCSEWCRAYVVCEGGACEPTTEQCGYRHRGRPAWDWLTEIDWLLDRLGVEDQRQNLARCRCGKPLPAATGGRAPVHCSAACRVAAHRAKQTAA